MTTVRFTDHFGTLAAGYAAHRPTYPGALFVWLAAQAPARERAWDCATGSGQAAVALADHFAEVVATDASADQIAHARPHPRVRYAVAPAEASGLERGAFDLVTVAQALHWFDRPAFYAEVERVLKPGGLLAVWMYNFLVVAAGVDRVVEHFYRDVLGPYWAFERKHVEEGYASMTFPMEPVEPPAFEMEARWTLDDLVGYLSTWSALKTCRAQTGSDPLPGVAEALAEVWGDPGERRAIRWPLALYVRRKPA
ncbi:MAG TPA: class I SAM-dependent methyltransferase [Rubricoccaceae bacterium]|nr:class I SAM-dependent methyltransferase [Rubricoccaceae bacterium]